MVSGTLNHALEVLMKRLQKNDRKVLADLYEVTSAHLYAIIFRILKDETKASEILKQVYLHIWNTRHDNLPADISAQNKLRSVAHRLAIDSHLQAKNAQPVPLLPDLADHDAGVTDILSAAYLNAMPVSELAKTLETSPENILELLKKEYPSGKEEQK